MTDQIRSIRLRPVASSVLNNSTNSVGSIYFDNTSKTLRLFDGFYADGVSMATRRWTLANTMNRVDVPQSATSTGSPGQMAFDADHIYVCVAENTWVRASLATW